MVFSGLVTAWRLAGCPTSRSPSSVKATIEGVVRMPSAFSMTFGVLPSITATQELVVPRSIPMTLPISISSLLRQAGRTLDGTRRKVSALILRKLLPTPNYTLNAAIRGFLAHIGEPVWAASHPFTDSRAAWLMGVMAPASPRALATGSDMTAHHTLAGFRLVPLGPRFIPRGCRRAAGRCRFA